MIDLGTMSISVFRVILKYELMSNSCTTSAYIGRHKPRYSLITSTSCPSFSDNVPDALSCGGGDSIAAIFFLFFCAKKLPKKPEPPSADKSSDGLDDLGGAAPGGSGLPVFGSTGVGLPALCRSLTIAIAWFHMSDNV